MRPHQYLLDTDLQSFAMVSERSPCLHARVFSADGLPVAVQVPLAVALFESSAPAMDTWMPLPRSMFPRTVFSCSLIGSVISLVPTLVFSFTNQLAVHEQVAADATNSVSPSSVDVSDPHATAPTMSAKQAPERATLRWQFRSLIYSPSFVTVDILGDRLTFAVSMVLD
jgi:hypothetical protein